MVVIPQQGFINRLILLSVLRPYPFALVQGMRDPVRPSHPPDFHFDHIKIIQRVGERMLVYWLTSSGPRRRRGDVRSSSSSRCRCGKHIPIGRATGRIIR